MGLPVFVCNVLIRKYGSIYCYVYTCAAKNKNTLNEGRESMLYVTSHLTRVGLQCPKVWLP